MNDDTRGFEDPRSWQGNPILFQSTGLFKPNLYRSIEERMEIGKGSIVQVLAKMSEPNDSPHNLKRGVVGEVIEFRPRNETGVTLCIIIGNDTYSKGETLTLRRSEVIIGSLVEEAMTKAEIEIEATDLIEDW